MADKHTPKTDLLWGKAITKKCENLLVKAHFVEDKLSFNKIAEFEIEEDLNYALTACNNYYALKAENTLLKEVNEAQIFTIEKYQKENEELTTELAKANSDKEKLGEAIKAEAKEYIKLSNTWRNAQMIQDANVAEENAKKLIDLLTDCGITL